MNQRWVRSTAEVAALLPAWRELAAATASSPWSDPDWLLAWAQVHRVQSRLWLLVVEGDDGLLAVAPFYDRRVGLPICGARVLQVLGSGPRAVLTELPEILTSPDTPRRTVAALVGQLETVLDRFDWVELPLMAHQGWWEEAWGRGMSPPAAVVHKTQRPSVVLELDESWTAALPPGKRNLRESVRRARNRLGRTGAAWKVVCVDDHDAGWPEAVATLRDLHGFRTRMGGPRHADDFHGTTTGDLLTGLAGRSAVARMQIWQLLVDGNPHAALLTAVDGRNLWVALGGMDELGWDVSGVTLLQYEAVRAAAEAGLTRATLSLGVDTFKLRWSEQVQIQQEFVLLGRRRCSRLRFQAFWQIRALDLVRRQLAHR